MAVACFTAQAQISTNNVSVNIGALVQNAQSVSSVTIQGQYWTVNGQTFFPNPPVTLGRYNYPAITNGVVIFSNTVCGIPYKLTLSGYSDYVTNFCIPASAMPDGSGNVSAAQYVGQYVSPTKFFWASPVVTNYNICSATNISNATGTNVSVSGSFTGTVNYPGTTNPAISSYVYGGGGTVINLYTPDGFDLDQYSIDSEIGTVGAYQFDPLGAASAATNGLVGASITNGLASTNYVNAATSGLATIGYVNAATNGFVTASITNGLTGASNHFTGKIGRAHV